MEGTTGRRPGRTSKFSVVFGSLLKVADHRVMVLLTFGLVFADLWLIADISTTILMICVIYRSATGRRLVGDWSATGCWWFSVVCNQSFTVRDCHMMVFRILAQTPVGDWLVTSWQPLAQQSPTSRPLVGDNRCKLEGSAKTYRPPFGNWSPMGGDLCAMVSDSPTINTDLLLTDCGPPVVLPVLN